MHLASVDRGTAGVSGVIAVVVLGPEEADLHYITEEMRSKLNALDASIIPKPKLKPKHKPGPPQACPA